MFETVFFKKNLVFLQNSRFTVFCYFYRFSFGQHRMINKSLTYLGFGCVYSLIESLISCIANGSINPDIRCGGAPELNKELPTIIRGSYK